MSEEQRQKVVAEKTAPESTTPEAKSAFRPAESRQGPTKPSTTDLRPDAAEGSTRVLDTLRRIEELVQAIGGRLELQTREQRHQEFSFARLIGALLQALVVGFVIAALADWAYQAPPGTQLVKLGFAAVLQVGVLTAFVLSRESR